mgnify:FL=1
MEAVDDDLEISQNDSDLSGVEEEDEEENDDLSAGEMYQKPHPRSSHKQQKKEGPVLNPLVLKHLRKNINPDNTVARTWLLAMESEVKTIQKSLESLILFSIRCETNAVSSFMII